VRALPGVVFDAGPSGLSASRTARLTWHGTAVDTSFDCRLDGGAWTACSSPYDLSALGDGGHTFAVRAATGGVVASRSWTVDTTPPSVIFDAGPQGAVASRTADLGFSVSESASVACSLDGSPFQACGSPQTLSGLGDGPHQLTVQAVDAAGNVGAAARAWTVDTTPPALELDPVATMGQGAVRLGFRTDAGAVTSCSMDGAAWASCHSGQTFTGLPAGPHTIVVRAADALGNATDRAAQFTVAAPLARPTSLAKAIVKALHKRSPRAFARLKPFRIRYRAPVAGRIKVSVAVHHGHTLLTGEARARTAGKRISIRIHRTGRAVASISRRRSARLDVTVRFTPADGRKSVSARRRFSIHR
jgi:hypothetical protein